MDPLVVTKVVVGVWIFFTLADLVGLPPQHADLLFENTRLDPFTRLDGWMPAMHEFTFRGGAKTLLSRVHVELQVRSIPIPFLDQFAT